ncbi:pyocin S6 family toxin immunity protein [Pseudomonas xanthosomatis]|uniref:pyocin S6 family toxin immunity protein n=1 Tax=Pseudomonas xanthosomatis TaxID=2842356 RepID=UPI0035160CC4
MQIRINGFLPDPNKDTSLKYQKKIPESECSTLLDIMGWASIEAGSAGEHEATEEQRIRIARLLGDPSLIELDLYVSTVD